jgi:tetratricopeptide (TPR) repeat protein
VINWPQKSRRTIFIAALLGAVTLASYWPVWNNGFIRYDDQQYITENVHVLNGLNPPDVAWAFRTGYAANWHPLTWLSHMLDVTLFGLRPGWHHFSSLLFHTANALLLFLVLKRLTQAEWRSAIVAALFALHPLHVESVAWAAERKDVLSTFLFLTTIWAYGRYVNSTPLSPRSARFYILALFLFGLGLMSKPMLVTLPFVLLLLDFWPLRRIQLDGTEAKPQGVRSLILEKLPFFSLALLSSVITFLVQGEGQAVVKNLPWSVRAANAAVSYVNYLGKTFWPANLAIFYPHPNARYLSAAADAQVTASLAWPAWEVGLAVLLLVGLSAFALVGLKQSPWLATGWFWFLGTLVPVIGLVQVGNQAMADRYTYIPLIGIFICVVWGSNELLIGNGVETKSPERRLGPTFSFAAGVLVAGCCAFATHRQAQYWRDDFTVFDHALSATGGSALAHYNVGADLGEEGRFDEAERHFRAALAIDPRCVGAHYYLGITLEMQGRLDQAIPELETALRIWPEGELARSHLGVILCKLGQRDEGLKQFGEALRLNPDCFHAHYELSQVLAQSGNLDGAAEHLEAAVRLKPNDAELLVRLAELQFRRGHFQEAEGIFRNLVQRYPSNTELRLNLGGTLWKLGLRPEALAQYAEATRLDPNHAPTHYNLATTLAAVGRPAEAEAQFAEAVHLKPGYLEALSELGKLLAARGRLTEACVQFQAAVACCPTNANLYLNLGSALMLSGKTNEAVSAFVRAAELQPDLPRRMVEEGDSLMARGQFNPALARFRTALWLKADDADALQDLAWLLATHPQPAARNGPEALALAQRAIQISGGPRTRLWAALDAAYAETGQFQQAINAAQKTRDLALDASEKGLAMEAEKRLSLYRSNKPYHQSEPETAARP